MTLLGSVTRVSPATPAAPEGSPHADHVPEKWERGRLPRHPGADVSLLASHRPERAQRRPAPGLPGDVCRELRFSQQKPQDGLRPGGRGGRALVFLACPRPPHPPRRVWLGRSALRARRSHAAGLTPAARCTALGPGGVPVRGPLGLACARPLPPARVGGQLAQRRRDGHRSCRPVARSRGPGAWDRMLCPSAARRWLPVLASLLPSVSLGLG